MSCPYRAFRPGCELAGYWACSRASNEVHPNTNGAECQFQTASGVRLGGTGDHCKSGSRPNRPCDCPSRRYLNARRPDDLRSFRSFAEHLETAIAIRNILWNREVTGVVCARGGTHIVDEPIDPALRTLLFEQSAVDNLFSIPASSEISVAVDTADITIRGKQAGDLFRQKFCGDQ